MDLNIENVKKVYLAGPFFNPEQRDAVTKVAAFLREKYEVFVPMEHFIKDGEDLPNDIWGKAVFDMDVEAIKENDLMVVLDYGFISDAGTAWEAGCAYALNIPSFIISFNSSPNPIHSLMLVNGCTKFFSSFNEFCHYINADEYKDCFNEIEQK